MRLPNSQIKPERLSGTTLYTVKVDYYCAGVYHLSRGHHSASVRAVGWLQDPVHTSTAKVSHAAGMDAMDGETARLARKFVGRGLYWLAFENTWAWEKHVAS
jgi:hypothetical protein